MYCINLGDETHVYVTFTRARSKETRKTICDYVCTFCIIGWPKKIVECIKMEQAVIFKILSKYRGKCTERYKLLFP